MFKNGERLGTSFLRLYPYLVNEPRDMCVCVVSVWSARENLLCEMQHGGPKVNTFREVLREIIVVVRFASMTPFVEGWDFVETLGEGAYGE